MHALRKCPKEGSKWNGYWVMGCHVSWTWRNKEDHDESFFYDLGHISHILNEYDKAKDTNSTIIDRGKTVSMVGWRHPSQNMVKLNAYYGCKGI